jgi:hypothetical protein
MQIIFTCHPSQRNLHLKFCMFGADRLPLVSSAIINVAQDVDEPWPLEVIGHDGKAYNVTMEPGDLVLYESHSVIHGMLPVLLYCMYITRFLLII